MLPTIRMSPVVFLVAVIVVASVSHHPFAQARARDDPLDDGRVSQQASQRLMRELKDFYKSDSYLNGIFTIDLIDDDIYEWHVKLFINDQDNPLYWDLQEVENNGGEDHILLHVKYNENYPIEPPFVRVVYPHLDTIDFSGAICMELLSKSGWNSSYTIEPLILSILVEKINKSRFARERKTTYKYTYEEAKEVFEAFEDIHIKDGKWI